MRWTVIFLGLCCFNLLEAKELFTKAHIVNYFDLNNPSVYASVGQKYIYQEKEKYQLGNFDTNLAMKYEEKDEIMSAFKAGDIDVLLSTTVIEVGVDVPKATIMMIEHAERFGLSQLHQLRGRVGRGADKSECLLIKSKSCSEDGLRRLQTMCETNDGFRIAEVDLEMRGPGEFLGTRQSGIPDFRIANLLRDSRVLEEAREDAFAIASSDSFMTSDKFSELRKTLKQRWGSRLELANIG